MQNNFQKNSSDIKQLSNQQLLSQIKFLVQKERNIHIQVLHHLGEINSRKLYLKLGFSSLFDYAVKELGYSEGAAYRRIKAMKLCRDLPDIESRLQSGRLSLSSACQLQAFFEKQAKKIKAEKSTEEIKREIQETNKEGLKTKDKSAARVLNTSQANITTHQEYSIRDKKESIPTPSLSVEKKQELVRKAEGCSTRATMKLLSEADPSLSIPKEQIRFLGKGKVEIKFVIDESCHKKLEELKSLLSHKNPVLSHRELLSILLEEALKKHDPRRKKVRKTSVSKEIVTFPQKLEEAYYSKKAWTRKSDKPAPSTPPQKGKYRSKAKKINRAIPSYLRKHIWERDEGQCTYVYPETKRKCSSKHLLQVDHIKPFSLGGKSEASNLRLLCAGHNQFRSEKTFEKRINYTPPI